MDRSAAGAALAIAALALTFQAQESLAQSQQEDEAIEEIVVPGRAHTFYRVDSSETATKTPTDFLSIPQSIQVLTRQLMEDQAATKITDLYRSISGINEFSYAGYTLRGFRQENEVKYDGVVGDPFTAFSVPQLFNIERVEILKGPSSMLYGVLEPGGLINYVTKKPTHDEQTSVTILAGNYNQLGVSGEYSGPLNSNDTVRLRLGGYAQQKEPFRNGSTEENTVIDAGVEFNLASQTTLLLQGTYMDQFMHGQRFREVPADENGNFMTSISWNAAEPTDTQALEAYIYQARLRRESDNGVTTTATVRVTDGEFLNWYHEPRGYIDTDNDGVVDATRRQFRDQVRGSTSKSLTIDNFFTADMLAMKHVILFGGDYSETTSDIHNRATPNFPDSEALSFQNPQYGNVDLTAINAALAGDPRSNDDTRYGFFLQDQVKLTERFEAVLGLRYDFFDSHSVNNNNNISAQDSDNKLSLRGGLIFRLSEDVASYFSYAEGFLPQAAANNQNASNGPFEPLFSDSYEIGIKGDLFGGAIQASAAVYQITKKNLLQADPDPNAPPFSLLSLGKVRSEGIEFDFTGDLSDNWALLFNYAYNETRIKEGVDGPQFTGGGFGIPISGQFINAPRNTFGLWTRYEFPFINSSIAGGLDYVDDRNSFNINVPVPSYMVYDLSWQTNWNNLNFQLNIKNLFDKEYALTGFSRGNFPGEPRTVVFQVSLDLGDR